MGSEGSKLGTDPIWDGNGGELDPAKLTQRDMQVLMHYKMDRVVLPMLRAHDEWIRQHEAGELSKAQRRTVLDVVQKDRDSVLERKNLRTPVLAAAIALATLALLTVQTIYLAGGFT